ncbi:MAG: hypothetical protein RI942_1669 [Pseudomonadota bacterium]|jgi:hypothetical protein
MNHFKLRNLAQRFIFVVSAILLSACASGPTYNPSTFIAEINQDALTKDKVKTVILSHVNISGPSRSYLEREEERIDALVSKKLKEAGYKVLPQRLFVQEWNTAVRAFGDPFDPTTGRVNMKTFVLIMNSVKDQLIKSTQVDAFVFTDIIEQQVAFNNGMNHEARWDGVSRKPTLQGPGTTIPGGFDWNQLAAVASLQVVVFDQGLERIFVGRGGMDATDAIDARSGTRFERRRNILESQKYVQEGIDLALHPWIEMADWPGKAP